MEKNITFQYIRKKLFLFKVLGISVVFTQFLITMYVVLMERWMFG